jgi:hypothetical protein
LGIAWREADGLEGGSITVTTGSAQISSHSCWRITGAKDPDTQAPEVGTAGNGTSANPDPPSNTPTGGAANFLWIPVSCNDDGRDDVTAWPYASNNINIGDIANSGGAVLGVCSKEENDSSDDPGTFTIEASESWSTQTVAVHPQ